MKSEKKKIPFGGRLLIYITVLLTLFVAMLAFWWYYLSCYEAGRIAGVMDSYMTEKLSDELEYAIDVYSFEQKSEYQSKDEIFAILAETLGGDRWNYRRINSKSTDDQIVYALCCGKTKIGEVAVNAVETNETALGFRRWQVSKAEFDLEQFGDTITVIAPYGCQVQVDGIAIGDNEVVETIGLYPELEAYEELITQPNQLLVYSLFPVFEDIAVEFADGYVKQVDETTGVVTAMPVCEDRFAEELIAYCEDFVKAYVQYTANKKSLWVLQQYIVPDCALYQEMTDSSVGLKWGHGVNAKITSLDIKNFKYYGNVVTCEASYFMTRSDGDCGETMEIMLTETVLGWQVLHVKVI